VLDPLQDVIMYAVAVAASVNANRATLWKYMWKSWSLSPASLHRAIGMWLQLAPVDGQVSAQSGLRHAHK